MAGIGADWHAMGGEMAGSEAEWGLARLRRPEREERPPRLDENRSFWNILGLGVSERPPADDVKVAGLHPDEQGRSRSNLHAESKLDESAATSPRKRRMEAEEEEEELWADAAEEMLTSEDEHLQILAEDRQIKRVARTEGAIADDDLKGMQEAPVERPAAKACWSSAEPVDAFGTVSEQQKAESEKTKAAAGAPVEGEQQPAQRQPSQPQTQTHLGPQRPQVSEELFCGWGQNAADALVQLPGWGFGKATGFLDTMVGRHINNFIEGVVTVSQNHEERYSSRTIPNPPGSHHARQPDGVSPSEQQEPPTTARQSSVAAAGGAEVQAYRGGVPRGGQSWQERVQDSTVEQLGMWLARVRTTLRGSAQDIGWLLREPGALPTVDGTDRFQKILGRTSNGVHTLPDTYVYLLVPGLFSNLGPLYFVETKRHLARLGLNAHIAKIHSEAAVETNARELCQVIEELHWGSGKQVVMLGHSKGGMDGCAALSMFRERLKGKVRGIVLLQSPYGGNPIASDLLREGQVGDAGSRAVLQALVKTVLKGDLKCLEDMTYIRRRTFLANHSLPPGLPMVCLHTECERAPSVISSLTTVANAEVPLATAAMTASRGAGRQVAAADGSGGRAILPVVMPIAGALAAIATHLDLRYGEKSDGLVTRKDAEVPGSVVVRPSQKLDHAWLVFGGKGAPGEADAAHVNEALLTLLLECTFAADGTAPVLPPLGSTAFHGVAAP